MCVWVFVSLGIKANLTFLHCWHDAADVVVVSGFDANNVVFPLCLSPRLCHCRLGALCASWSPNKYKYRYKYKRHSRAIYYLRAIIVRAIVRRTVLVAHGFSERDTLILRCNLCAHCSVQRVQKFSFVNHPHSVSLIKKLLEEIRRYAPTKV